MGEQKIVDVLREMLALLVRHDYGALERLTRGVRLTAAEMAEAISDYGGTLVMPPQGEIERADVVRREGAAQPEWSVWMRLWTAEEGESDLTLQLTLRDSGRGAYDVEIDNLHVP